jgi:GABA permease
MWLYPVLTILTIAGMAAVLVAMWFQPDTRSQILLSLASAAVVITAWALRRAVFGGAAAPAE